MKTLRLLFILLFVTTIAIAQSPNAFNYQTVLRDNNANLLTNQLIGIQISILQGSNTGSSVYSETHEITSNNYGLVNLMIGNGATVDDFSSINWADELYFIQVGIDVSGGDSYLLIGTSQLVSVPYALHAKTAENLTNNNKHYIGELFGGGIVFWIDQTSEHGLIASLNDIDGGNGIVWSNIDDIEIGTSAQNHYDGKGNSTAIIGQSGHTSGAAQLCSDYSNDGFTDWYLPSILELKQTENALLIINNVLSNDGDATTNTINVKTKYWSSTEYNNSLAWFYFNYGGGSPYQYKNDTYRVRAVRAF